MTDHKTSDHQPDLESQLEQFGSALGSMGSLRARIVNEIRHPASLVEEASADSSNSHSNQKPSILEGMTMFQKVSLGSLAASVLVVGIAWMTASTPAITFAQVAKNLRDATSYEVETRMTPIVSSPQQNFVAEGKTYWRSNGSMRMEHHNIVPTNPDMQATKIQVVFPNKPGIRWEDKSKTYSILPPRKGAISPLMAIDQLAKYEGQAARTLNQEEINGVACDGFEIPLEEIDVSAGKGKLAVWVNPETQLPAKIVLESLGMKMVMEKFKWNKKLDDSLFSTKPPVGYTERKPRTVPVGDQLKEIVSALKLYAELSQGSYPQVKVIYGDVIRGKMMRMAGLGGPFKPEFAKDKNFGRISQSTNGFARMMVIMRENGEATYHGMEVGPHDKDKVLFRWKLDDGSYQNIFGDLHTEISK